ncbi:hypothetical protein SAMN02745216_02168 [Desulfatibacillum alkenivorans DSM 16219]|jgi:uncharacterized membrane protein YfcA|uniref:Probable membrane transporter protein n=1 Tax=Desulfatibacillum alkenivorans DSM 16219 TaxID=1121393 RepID=A0A1M6LS17_9BACT|nr:sulfite exporter TauE/SafE family protein [Desulfatibacillum alkenivorans]SHJ73977.1 hypothetical protein SAMN02745216_02168 [Desulfatibacillum alkenivorans DSM 16219]
MELLMVGFAVVLASLLMGLAGFGFAIAAISLMSFVWPVRQIVPFLFVFNLCINVVLLTQLRSYIKPSRVWPQTAGFIPGGLLGLMVLKHSPDSTLKLMIGVTLVIFAVWSLWGRGKTVPQISKKWGFTAGVLGGILGGSVYMPGPPVILLNSLTHTDRFAFKADLQTYFLFSNLFLVFAYADMGLFSLDLLKVNLMMAPLMLGGLAAGSIICRHVSDQRFKRIAHGLILIMGCLLVLRALGVAG